MLPFNFVLAKFYARWLIINEEPANVCEEWRKAPRRKYSRQGETDPACVRFVEWVMEQLVKQGASNILASFSMLRWDETQPYSAENCEIVPRSFLCKLTSLRKKQEVTQEDIKKMLEQVRW